MTTASITWPAALLDVVNTGREVLQDVQPTSFEVCEHCSAYMSKQRLSRTSTSPAPTPPCPLYDKHACTTNKLAHDR